MSKRHLKIIMEDLPGEITWLDFLALMPGGGDYPLTYHQALDMARRGNMVRCSISPKKYIYWRSMDCLVCHWEQPSNIERHLGWRVVHEEVQP